MFNQIQLELSALEQLQDIKILYAVESGSRAWGFPSADSDWDVRFIYVHQPPWYLSIDDKKDNIEKMLPDNIDLSGWEIRKALRLFRKSNPPLLEWLRSPLIYSEKFTLVNTLRELSSEYFNPKSCLYHYFHMALRNFNQYLKHENVRVKKYFYVLRPVLACQWIEKTNTMAPMEFQSLINTLVDDVIVKNEINELLKRKLAGEELHYEPQNKILNDFLQNKLNHYTELIKTFKSDTAPDIEKLNQLFRKTLQEVWADSSII